jgi:hypothetical protein
VTGHNKSCTADILSETANSSLHNTPYHPPSILTGSTYHILTVKAVVMAKSFQVIQIIKNVELKTLLAAVRIEPTASDANFCLLLTLRTTGIEAVH